MQQVAVPIELSPAVAEAGSSEGLVGRDGQLEEKFRSFYFRHLKLEDSFPVHIEHTAATRREAGVNKWKFPDLVVLDWDVGESNDRGFTLDTTALQVKLGLGEQPFRLSSVELKVDLSLGTFREFFFQCVSNSMWAHSASLIIACSISDSLLADELRRLGTSYGGAIETFGFTRDELAKLPSASEIMMMSDSDFEKILADRSSIKLTSGKQKSALDWDHVRDMKSLSGDFAAVFDWIARCLHDRNAYSMERYKQLIDIQRRPG